MTEPEKYTLDRVLEIVQYHAAKLGTAGQALEVTEGKDPEVLAMLGERALKAAKAFWYMQGENVLDEDADAAWDLLSEDHGALWALPVLALAVEAATTNPQDAMPPEPDGSCPAGQRFTWCHYEAKRIAKDLMGWVMAHEKDVDQPKEIGAGGHPISHIPHKPQEATHTLPEVIEVMRDHAVALGFAAKGLQATEGKDPNLLAHVGECAAKA